METLNSRKGGREASEWTALEFVGAVFDNPPSTPRTSPLQIIEHAGSVSRSEDESCDSEMRNLDNRTHSACPGMLDEQLVERLTPLFCVGNASRFPQRVPCGLKDRRGGPVDVTGNKDLPKISPRRRGPSDAESMRLPENYSPRCTTTKHQAKSKLEALSDSQSLQVLEYWTQKLSGEKMWE